jgi:hypothetical protein
MTAIPPPIHTIANLIDEHHASQPDEPRLHLGGSMLGHPCDRWLWLSFRWAVREKFPGRIRRLFRRGNNEEDIITAISKPSALISTAQAISSVLLNWIARWRIG